MKCYVFTGLLLTAAFAFPLAAQMPEGYLDIDVAKVKKGKRTEFDNIGKRMAELNRRNKGDSWIAFGVLYGETGTVNFVSPRASYGAAEEGTKLFEEAISKSIGKPGMQKMFDSWDATVESEHPEIRRRRWDLSAYPPANPAAYFKLIGSSRYLRVVTIHTRPGKILEFEAAFKNNRAAQERVNPDYPQLVSQAVAGQQVGTYYIATPVKSLADLDKMKPLAEVLGSAYADYQRITAECVSSLKVEIMRFLPEISNPPDEIVAVDTKFWRPAPTPTAPSAPAPAAAAPAAKPAPQAK